MKRILSILLIFIFAVSLLFGCGKKTGEAANTGTDASSATETETEIETEPAPPETLDDPYPDEGFDPPLWKVTSSDGKTLYLFGTMHAGTDKNDSILARVDKVLSRCDSLAVEFDVVAYQQDLAGMMNDIQAFVLRDGTTVKDHSGEELYEKMASALKDCGLYSPLYDTYSLSMWSQLIEQVYLMKSSVSTDFAIDSMLIERAYALGLPVLDVESASFQYNLLASFSDEINKLLIRSTLDMTYEEYDELLTRMYEAWLKGDTEAILDVEDEEYGEEPTEEEQKLLDYYELKMITERNEGMAKKAIEYIESGDTVFFAVGTAHMLDEKGVVNLLTEAGYTVERISVND